MFPVLACLLIGVGIVAMTSRDASEGAVMERVGGVFVVLGLIGLGYALAG